MSSEPEIPEIQHTENITTTADPASASLAAALSSAFWLLKAIIALAIIFFFLRGFFVVETGKTYLVRRFGAYVKQDDQVKLYQPGIVYYAIPIIDQPEAIETRTFEINLNQEFMPQKQNLRAVISNSRPQDSLRPGFDSYGISGDMNIVHSRWHLTYQIRDPYRFRTTIQEQNTGYFNKQTGRAVMRSGPEELLRLLFCNSIIKVTAGTLIEDILGKGKAVYERRVQQSITRTLSPFDSGIEVTGVQLVEPLPPKVTIQAFNEVSKARSEKRTIISKAIAKAQEITNKGRGRAKEIIDDASVYAEKIVSAARSDAANLDSLLQKFPHDNQGLNIYLSQYHYEVLTEIMAESKYYVVRPGSTWYVTGPGQLTAPEEDKK